MAPFNAGYRKVFREGGITVGVMTPMARRLDAPADMAAEHALARRADELGFAALWTRDVPLVLPQGSDQEAAVLDDPFIWLSGLAGATKTIAVGTAAIVLPIRHPLHVVKLALSMDRLSGGRFLLGMGAGDRPAEFAAFGVDGEARGRLFRDAWLVVRAALVNEQVQRAALLQATGGVEVLAPPPTRIPMLVVGTARQSLQWIAAHAEAWATYHREEERQKGRIGLWQAASHMTSPVEEKPFVQSLQLDLLEDPDAAPEPIELGMRTGWRGLLAYLRRLPDMGVRHTILNLSRGHRPAEDMIDDIGRHVLPALKEFA